MAWWIYLELDTDPRARSGLFQFPAYRGRVMLTSCGSSFNRSCGGERLSRFPLQAGMPFFASNSSSLLELKVEEWATASGISPPYKNAIKLCQRIEAFTEQQASPAQ
jgi:hypothetical protein